MTHGLRERALALGIPEADLRGATFTEKPPPNWEAVGGSYFRNTKDFPDQVAGLYERISATIYVAPLAPDTVLVHEIGHHVTLTVRPQNWRIDIWETVIADIGNSLSYSERRAMGIRPYSLSSWQDLLADIHAVFYTGKPGQWDRLEAWTKKRCYHLRMWIGLPLPNECSITQMGN